MSPLLVFAIRLMELLFVIGCSGSLIVIVVSGVEDIETIMGAEHEAEPQPSQAAK